MKNGAVYSILLAFVFFNGEAQSQGNSVSLTWRSEIVVPLPAIPQAAVADELDRPYFYLAAKTGGLQVYSLPPEAQPVLLKTLSISKFDNLEVMNACQRGQLLYLALGNFFGANGQKPGLAVVDVSNPLEPVVKDVWAWNIQDKGAAYVTVSGQYAYLAAMSQGLIILNIADPDNIAFVSQYRPDPDFPLPNPPAAQIPNVRGLAIRDDVAYLCYDAGGLRAIDLSDKMHPAEIGRYINATPFAPAGKQQAFNNIVLDGATAYVAVDYCGLEVLDVSNPTQMVQKSWWNPWQCHSVSNLWFGSPGHTNQIDLSADRRLLFISSAQRELSVLDVSDPAKPLLAAEYGALDDQLGTWGMTLHGDRVMLLYILAGIPFQSKWAGVKILKWGKTSATDGASSLVYKSLYPNPFPGVLYFEFELRVPGKLLAELYDVQGKKVARLAEGYHSAGLHELRWAGDLPAGVYLFRLETSEGVLFKKVVGAGK